MGKSRRPGETAASWSMLVGILDSSVHDDYRVTTTVTFSVAVSAPSCATHRRTYSPGTVNVTVPAVLSGIAYLLSYHRYRRMLLETQAGPTSARWAGFGSRLLEYREHR